jgi:nucleoside-diphosphate-sugar epimerase
VCIDNVSARYGSLIVVGPQSRALLAQLTRADLANEAFPWLAVRTIDIGYTRAIALRVNYVGELGWELHVPTEHVLSVYDLIWAAGEPLGIADYGLYAMDSLRLEKCYRAWKGDLTTEYTPFMASLDRFVKLEKPGGFIGQAALRREAGTGPKERFVPLLVEAADAASVARLVHVSSQAAVGPSADPAGVGPEAPPSPVSDYGRSKLCGERAVAALGTEAWWVIVRPPAIYGPRDTDVLEFFRMASRGLAVVPAGERWITVAHVGDVVRGLLAAAASGESGRIYHLGEPEPRRLDRMLHELAAAGGKTVRVVPLPLAAVGVVGAVAGLLRRSGLVSSPLTRDKTREIAARHWSLRTADSLRALGVEAPISFPEGARSTWAWYRNEGWLR